MKKISTLMMVALAIAMVIFLIIIWSDAEIPVAKKIMPSVCYIYIMIDSLRRAKMGNG